MNWKRGKEYTALFLVFPELPLGLLKGIFCPGIPVSWKVKRKIYKTEL